MYKKGVAVSQNNKKKNKRNKRYKKEGTGRKLLKGTKKQRKARSLEEVFYP
jgi:hypothetical protein